MFFLLFCHVPLLNLFCQTCWKFQATTKVLLSTVYISISFPFIWCLSTLYFLEILCYINWYAKINTLNACNHLATSYSHIPKTCAFDYYTNTCINISTFLEQFCLWSKHFFFSMLRYKNSCIISISFQEFGATHSTHANTHMKGINFTLNLLQSFISNPLTPPPSLKGERSLNMAVLFKHKNIFYTTTNLSSHDNTAL